MTAQPSPPSWVVTTDAVGDRAQAVTSLSPWEAETGVSLHRCDDRPTGARAVAQLRAAGHVATVRRTLPWEAERIRAELEEIGRVRAERNAAEAQMKSLVVRYGPERTLMQELRDAGMTTAEIARTAHCDRNWVYQLIGAGGARVGTQRAETRAAPARSLERDAAQVSAERS